MKIINPMPSIPTFSPAPRQSSPAPIVFLLSIIGGLVGAFILFWFFPDLRIARIPPGTQSVILEKPGQVVVEESTRLSELARQNARLVGAIVPKDAAIVLAGRRIYPSVSARGGAIMLTQNGWFATTASVGAKIGDEVVIENSPYPIAEIISDPASPIVIGRATGGNFTSATFIDSKLRETGMTVFVLAENKTVTKAIIASETLALDANSKTVLSDRFMVAIGLDESGDTIEAGLPVFSLDGTLVGITEKMADKTIVIPSGVISTLLASAIINAPLRSGLGLSYIFDAGNGAEIARAFVVYGEKSGGIEPKSAAAQAGFKTGDRILSINGQPVLEDEPLFNVIQNFQPGSQVRFAIERDGQKIDITAVLSSNSGNK